MHKGEAGGPTKVKGGPLQNGDRRIRSSGSLKGRATDCNRPPQGNPRKIIYVRRLANRVSNSGGWRNPVSTRGKGGREHGLQQRLGRCRERREGKNSKGKRLWPSELVTKGRCRLEWLSRRAFNAEELKKGNIFSREEVTSALTERYLAMERGKIQSHFIFIN